MPPLPPCVARTTNTGKSPIFSKKLYCETGRLPSTVSVGRASRLEQVSEAFFKGHQQMAPKHSVLESGTTTAFASRSTIRSDTFFLIERASQPRHIFHPLCTEYRAPASQCVNESVLATRSASLISSTLEKQEHRCLLTPVCSEMLHTRRSHHHIDLL